MRPLPLISLTGTLLLTALLATRTHLPLSGPHAEPVATLLTITLLFAFGYALFALFLHAVALLPSTWPGPLSWSAVVAAALLLALLLRFYQFMPAFLVLGWCEAGLPCGEAGNQAFNSLLSAGRGLLIGALLPAVTVPVMLYGYWLQRRVNSAGARAA
jgi:hypothetical protein